MQVDHRGRQFRVAQQHLYFSDIVSGFQKMRCKAVTQCMNTGASFDADLFLGLLVDSADRLVAERIIFSLFNRGREQIVLRTTMYVIVPQLVEEFG